jgi:hypothetical protein
MKRRILTTKKLLVASIGVATVTYVACSSTSGTSGNLVAPPPGDGAADVQPDNFIIGSGNLVAPPPPDGGDADAPSDAPADAPSDAPGEGG